jgi:hypothetical protein
MVGKLTLVEDFVLHISFDLVYQILGEDWLLSDESWLKSALSVNAFWVDVLVAEGTMFCVIVKSFVFWDIVIIFLIIV